MDVITVAFKNFSDGYIGDEKSYTIHLWRMQLWMTGVQVYLQYQYSLQRRWWARISLKYTRILMELALNRIDRILKIL